MDDYPTADEEFELMYQDELELFREQEDNNAFPAAAKVKRTLDFSTAAESTQNESQSSSIFALSQDVPLTANSNNSFELIDSVEDSTCEAQPLSKGKKRTASELFGDIDDISDDELDRYGRPKKRKSVNEDLMLIDRILELRTSFKERQNPLAALSRQSSNVNTYHSKDNISYEVPKYSFVPVTRSNGDRVYVRCHSEQYEKEEISKIAKKGSFSGIMGEAFKKIWKEAEEHLNKNLDMESDEAELPAATPGDTTLLKEAQNANLWVDVYKPIKYLELLSDESTNRTLLRWMKLWDKVVFNRRSKPKPAKVEVETTTKPELSMKVDEHGRPEYKVVLLCGPPGLGKTTLAHIVAKHAGYNVVEVNASDDRSAEKFKTVLENATQMRSVVDKENRPNCLVFDEIDGAPSSSIDFLIRFINGTAGRKKKKGAPKQTGNTLKRPIICICNDVYVPALRPLRQIAFVVNFPPTASSRLADRLQEIAVEQQIKADSIALLALCEKSGNDIRSCLSVLHFFKSLHKPITLSQVHKASIGQKDMQKGLFAVWQEIFQIQRLKQQEIAVETNGNSQQNNISALASRLYRIVKVVTGFGDYERLAQGVFENYPSVNMKDSTMLGTCEALEWFCFMDVLNSRIYTLQNYSLASYLPYAFAVWHFAFANLMRQKLNYPSAGYEARTKASKSASLLAEVMKGMQPVVRAFTCSSSLRLDTLPILSHVITPLLRPVNLHLYTDQEREQLKHVVSAMIDYNLNYVQERMPEGNYVFNIDPNIEEITLFPGSKPKRPLSYNNKQLIAREIEMEKMRRVEAHKVKDADASGGRSKDANVEAKQLPNQMQKLKAKTLKPKADKVVAKDFFGRVITQSASANKAGPEFKNDIWYQFKEGYNNAVRKRIKISTVL